MSDDLTHDKALVVLSTEIKMGKTQIIAEQVYGIGDGCAAHYKG